MSAFNVMASIITSRRVIEPAFVKSSRFCSGRAGRNGDAIDWPELFGAANDWHPLPAASEPCYPKGSIGRSRIGDNCLELPSSLEQLQGCAEKLAIHASLGHPLAPSAWGKFVCFAQARRNLCIRPLYTGLDGF